LLKEPQVGYPRVAVLVDESAPGAHMDESATPATDAITQALLNKGYRVVERGSMSDPKAADAAKQIEQGNLSAAQAFGNSVDAEVLVLGSAKATLFQANGFGGLVSYRTSLNAKAYQAKTGEVLMTSSKIAPGLEATPETAASRSLANAGQQAGDELADQLARQLTQRAYAQISISGIPDLNHLQDIEKAIIAAPAAGDCYLRSFSGGEAHFDVQLKDGSAKDIAASIERNASLKVKVTAVTQNTIQGQQQL